MSPELEKKVNRAIHLIQVASQKAEEIGQPLEIAFSGGKDSCVILELTKMAGVKYRAIYKNTTIDPPQTIKFCKDNGCEIMTPQKTFLEIIKERGFPYRTKRVCCDILKEYKVLDYSIVGIRSDESRKRKELYKEPELCRKFRTGKVRQYYPILDWNLQDVYEFVTERKIKLHPLYYDKNGNLDVTQRLGCMCCPLESKKKRIEQFKKWPNMVKLYASGGGYWLDNHPLTKTAQCHKDVYEWLVSEIFCESFLEFQQRFGKNLFNDGIDCKKFLEGYFNIKF